MTMTHPGLPDYWGLIVIGFMIMAAIWVLLSPTPVRVRSSVLSLANIPLIGSGVSRLIANRWILLSLKFVLVGFFLLIIIAGLFGTPLPE